MENLTWEKVSKDLYTAVLIQAGCGIVAGICAALGLVVPFLSIIGLIFSLGAVAAGVWFFISLGNWKKIADANDVPAVHKLWLYSLLGIIAGVISVIPVVGGIIGGLVSLAGLIIYILGVTALKASTTLPANVVEGAKKLHLAVVLAIVGAVVGIIPVIGVVGAILTIVAFVLQILAWKKIANA